MKRIRIARVIFVILVVHAISYNSYYGWNNDPINKTEELNDIISKILFWAFFFFYTSPIYGLYEDSIERLDQRKEAEKNKWP